MGIKNFFKLLKGQEISLKDISDDKIAIDCMPEIYRALLGMPNTHTLTDPNGNPTAHINIIIQMARKFQKANIKQIYVFDSPIPVPEKQQELERRADSRPPVNMQYMIEDIKYVLSMMGITWVVAPDGYDAEHVCAELYKRGDVTYILTNDADAFIYGGEYIIRREKVGNKPALMLYNVEDLKSQNKLSDEDLLKIAVILGTDFCGKSPRIGVKTVIKKVNSVELSECQLQAIEVFKRRVTIPQLITNKPNNSELLDWLVSRGFNYTRMTKILM